MRILHTADWHLGDSLGIVDRTEDLFSAVDHVLNYCVEHEIDTLLVAGDVFEDYRGDGFSRLMCRLAATLRPHLERRVEFGAL